MKTKLYSWVCFNNKGNLRGFASGFTKSKAKELIMQDLSEDKIVIQINSLSDLPSKFIEGYYHKTSTNNDLIELLTLMLKKP